MTTTSPTRAQFGVALVAVAVLAWIALVVVSILNRPPTGEADLGRLAASTQSALTARDADDFDRLLDQPDSDVAASYIAAIDQGTRGPLRVVVAPGDRLDVSGLRTDGTAFSYPLKATRNEDDRWVLGFTPPL